MPLFKKKRKFETATQSAVLDYRTAHKLAMILEKAKLGEYVTLMGKPWRNIWVNFIAGVARGAGMVVGTVLVGGLLVVLLVQSLKYVAKHSDMVPWIGDQVKEGVGFVLKAADEKLNLGDEDGERPRRRRRRPPQDGGAAPEAPGAPAGTAPVPSEKP